MSLVSIIIPNYNQTQFICSAIESVLSQTYHSYEIIVVDDGSTDDSWQVIGGYGDQVRYIWQENQGLGGARNTGILASKGEMIGLLDADDQWLPDYLETMVALADQKPDADVFYCQAQAMDKNGQDLPQKFGGLPLPPDKIYQTLLRANFLIPSTILMRRAPIISNGLFDQTIRSMHGCEDWDLWLRLLNTTPRYIFIGSPACLVRYRLHGNSLSVNPTSMQGAVRAVIEKHFGSDDGERGDWSWEKRRAYGGVYRYYAITSVQRMNDWQLAGQYLGQAFQADPSLADDLDLFYELGLGSQSAGYRGTAYQLELEENAKHLNTLLEEIFSLPKTLELEYLRPRIYGTAYFALGLIAYNTCFRALTRRFLSRALYYRPKLFCDTLVIGDWIKSLIPRSMVQMIKGPSKNVINER